DPEVFAPSKYPSEDSDFHFENFKTTVEMLFATRRTLLFIMATGIVIRTIKDLIGSKDKDPAILVMDEKGFHIISLLSGHLGRANEKTNEIAGLIGADPVITTASDVSGSMAVDTFAMDHGLTINDLTAAKDITAMIINGEKVAMINNSSMEFDGSRLPENVFLVNGEVSQDCQGVIAVSIKMELDLEKRYVILHPKTVIAGMGCRRNTTFEELKNALRDTFSRNNISIDSLKGIATVDLKEDEKGLMECASYFKVPLMIIPRNEILKVEDKFTGSDFVRKSIGVGSVAEPCGYLASDKGRCIEEKHRYEGITISVWESSVEVLKC
ncbi:MAG: cobalt-precorrin 5A hydrolase, partial [Eubacteriaceae bacterium]|nr:cobalt-precorrin 5A hydrolase [Eubacteriaceae bacterium]